MHQTKLFGVPQDRITTDDYYTPRWVFDALAVTFDIDVSSPPGGPPFVPCRKYFTLEDDGLAQPWDGLVWMNPPFSNLNPWINRFVEHGNGIALLPLTRNFCSIGIFENPDVKTLLLHDYKKVALWFHRGKKKAEVNYSIFLYAMGEQAQTALYESNLGYVR